MPLPASTNCASGSLFSLTLNYSESLCQSWKAPAGRGSGHLLQATTINTEPIGRLQAAPGALVISRFGVSEAGVRTLRARPEVGQDGSPCQEER